MKLLAFTKYSYEGPSSRYRFYNYKEYFSEKNIEMTIRPLFSKRYFTSVHKWQKILVVFVSYFKRLLFVLEVLFSPKKYDLVLIEYELFPYFPTWFEYLLVFRDVKYLVDYDDAIFHKYDRHSNRMIRKLLTNKIAKVMMYAHTVIVCNPYLEAYAKKVNKNTFTIPTVVQLDEYIEVMMKHQSLKGKFFVIGWVGSYTTGIYLLDILPVMKKFVHKYDNVRFNLVGFNEKLLSDKDRQKAHIDVMMWSEEKEIENILDFDVGIMPLLDDGWSRGKCAFKLIQYMSCKKPVVASAVGTNIGLVEEGKNGFLVRNKEEWFNALEKLYLDVRLRKKMGQNNFKKIEKEYNNKIYNQRYVELLNSFIL